MRGGCSYGLGLRECCDSVAGWGASGLVGGGLGYAKM